MYSNEHNAFLCVFADPHQKAAILRTLARAGQKGADCLPRLAYKFAREGGGRKTEKAAGKTRARVRGSRGVCGSVG